MILITTALVLFMALPGLALFCGWLVQSRYLPSVFTDWIAIASLVSVVSLVVVCVPVSHWFRGGGAVRQKANVLIIGRMGIDDMRDVFNVGEIFGTEIVSVLGQGSWSAQLGGLRLFES